MSNLAYLVQNTPYKEDPIMKSLVDGNILWGDISMNDDTMHTIHNTNDNITVINTSNLMIVNNTYIPPYNGIKTLIVRNLPRQITQYELQQIFIKYGPIKDIYIPKNKDINSPYYATIKGFCLIKFFSPDDARRAYIGSIGLRIHNNRCSIEFAKNDR